MHPAWRLSQAKPGSQKMLHTRADVPMRAVVTWMIMIALVSVTLRYAYCETSCWQRLTAMVRPFKK